MKCFVSCDERGYTYLFHISRATVKLGIIKQPYTPLSSPGGGGVLDWERVQRGAGHVQTYPDRPDRRHPQRAASAHEWDLHRRHLRISPGVCVPSAVVTHVLLQPPGFTSMFPWEAVQRIRGWCIWIHLETHLNPLNRFPHTVSPCLFLPK